MNPATAQPEPGRSWRHIRQEVTPRAMSSRGLRRRVAAGVKVALFLAVAVALAWGAYGLTHAWNTDRGALATAAHGARITRVIAQTDGVLSQDWVVAQLALPTNTTLMAVDLTALRDRLLAHGQVKMASVSRQFPDRIIVALQERAPVARVRVEDGLGPARTLLVAADGVVFPGINHENTLVAGLPWLAGFALQRAGRGYAPIAGMETAARLLKTAQIEAPWLYQDWVIVSLARLPARDELVVTNGQKQEFVFAAAGDFFKQIAQLDYVIDRAAQAGLPPPATVNLALGGQVPVKFNAEAAAPAPEASAPRFDFSQLSPTNQRRTIRDL
jgi:cell division protein FtsQ